MSNPLNARAALPVQFHQPKPYLRWLAVALAVSGCSLSAGLFAASIFSADAGFISSLCGGSNDCESVLRSPYAYIAITPDLRIPISTLSMPYFACLGLWFLFVGPPARNGRFWHLVPLLVVLAGALASANYVYIMAAVLHRWCRLCLTVHALNAALLVTVIATYPFKRVEGETVRHPSARLALATLLAGGFGYIALLSTAAAMFFGVWHQAQAKTWATVLDDPAFIVWDYQRQPVVDIPPRAPDEGAAGTAPLHVVVFADLECPDCRAVHRLLNELEREHAGQLTVTLRHLPDDGACNPDAALGGPHRFACRAAAGVEAARAVGGGTAARQFEQALWEAQDQLRGLAGNDAEPERELLNRLATNGRLDRSSFETALAAPATMARVREDVALAKSLGIRAVPTVYANGRLVRNPGKKAAWEALLGALAPGASSAPSTQATSGPR